jgi:hypothetical protein
LIEALAPSPPPPAAPANPDGQPTPAEVPTTTPEQNALIGDLHWLIHQGHVIEFANGTLETAKKPLPRPPRPAPRKEEKASPATPEGAVPEAANATATQPQGAEPDASGTQTEPSLTNETESPDKVPSLLSDAPGIGSPIEEVTTEQRPVEPADKHEGSLPETTPGPASAELPAAPVESPS